MCCRLKVDFLKAHLSPIVVRRYLPWSRYQNSRILHPMDLRERIYKDHEHEYIKGVSMDPVFQVTLLG